MPDTDSGDLGNSPLGNSRQPARTSERGKEQPTDQTQKDAHQDARPKCTDRAGRNKPASDSSGLDAENTTEQTVYTRGRPNRKRRVLHTDRECERLQRAKTITPHPRSAYPDDVPICSVCEHGVRGGPREGQNPNATREALLDADPEDFGLDRDRLVTDGGMPTPTQLGYRSLWVLAGQSRTVEALRSELAASFAVDSTAQAVRRTCRSLAEYDYVTARAREDGTQEYVITARGRHLAYGELAAALDHADLSAALSVAGHRLANAEPATQDALPPRRTRIEGDENVRTDGGRTPSDPTPLSYQERCQTCARIIGMSATYCKHCGAEVDPTREADDAAERRLLTGGGDQ